MKMTSGVKKPIAYFYGILMKQFKQHYYEELYEEHGLSKYCSIKILKSNKY
jgi:hypothetical protein